MRIFAPDGSAMVSIHAPARGATSRRVYCCIEHRVSIHAPARGATLRGCLFSPWLTVSIHAPARGATYHRHNLRQANKFQSTRPRGARLSFSHFVKNDNMFQSTRPRGARPYGSADRGQIGYSFNPRAREGRDEVVANAVGSAGAVSIHAPARGATRSLAVSV